MVSPKTNGEVEMSKMIVDGLRRTGSATSKFRQIVAVQGKDKRTLNTVIEKVEWAPQFRFGAEPKPMEQYAFRVRGKIYERFADATAAVMKIHHIEVAANELEDAQEYVKRAAAILAGTEEIRLAQLPEEAAQAA